MANAMTEVNFCQPANYMLVRRCEKRRLRS